jgi:hypothetical protein
LSFFLRTGVCYRNATLLFVSRITNSWHPPRKRHGPMTLDGARAPIGRRAIPNCTIRRSTPSKSHHRRTICRSTLSKSHHRRTICRSTPSKSTRRGPPLRSPRRDPSCSRPRIRRAPRGESGVAELRQPNKGARQRRSRSSASLLERARSHRLLAAPPRPCSVLPPPRLAAPPPLLRRREGGREGAVGERVGLAVEGAARERVGLAVEGAPSMVSLAPHWEFVCCVVDLAGEGAGQPARELREGGGCHCQPTAALRRIHGRLADLPSPDPPPPH